MPLVRAALPGDADALVALETGRTPMPWPEQRLRSACAGAPAAALVAEVNAPGGALVAYLVYQCLLDEVTVQQIAVRADWRGRGVGRMLLERGLDEWARDGMRRSLLEVRSSNAPAIGLYRRCGFEQDGVRRGYYPACHPATDARAEGREDALLMSCELTPRAARADAPSGGGR